MKIMSLKSWTYHAEMSSNPGEPLKVYVTYGRRKPEKLCCVSRIHDVETGFDMGYCGEGPARLALAILYDYFRRFDMEPEKALSLALPLHQEFKLQFIATAGKRLYITDQRIDQWLAYQPETRVAMAS